MKEKQRPPRAIEEREVALKMAMNIIKNDLTMRKMPRSEHEAAAASTYAPPEYYIHKLLKLAGNYGFGQYIEIDLRNGQPYFVHEEYSYEGYFGWMTQRFPHKITFEVLRKLASAAGKGKEYNEINQSNWKDYIP